MSDLTKTLNLTKVNYTAKYTFKKDEVTGLWIGIIENNDLTVVLKNESKDDLKKELDQTFEMHCYMSSMDAIYFALNLLKISPNEMPSANILVPIHQAA